MKEIEETETAYKIADRKKTSDVPEEKPVNKKFVNQCAAAVIVVAGILGFSAFNPEFKAKVNKAVTQNTTFGEFREKAERYAAIINAIRNPFGIKDVLKDAAPENQEVPKPPEIKPDRIDFEALESLELGTEN